METDKPDLRDPELEMRVLAEMVGAEDVRITGVKALSPNCFSSPHRQSLYSLLSETVDMALPLQEVLVHYKESKRLSSLLDDLSLVDRSEPYDEALRRLCDLTAARALVAELQIAASSVSNDPSRVWEYVDRIDVLVDSLCQGQGLEILRLAPEEPGEDDLIPF